jgi:folate-dependent phosphoribosylglycinamide formyltransferase PurN
MVPRNLAARDFALSAKAEARIARRGDHDFVFFDSARAAGVAHEVACAADDAENRKSFGGGVYRALARAAPASSAMFAAAGRFMRLIGGAFLQRLRTRLKAHPRPEYAQLHVSTEAFSQVARLMGGRSCTAA